MKSRMWAAAMVCTAALVMNGCAVPGERWDGYLKTNENMAKIWVGSTTAGEAQQLLGAPVRVSHDGRRNWDYWEYRLYSQWPRSKLWIGISSDGVVREVIQVPERDRPGLS